MKTEEIQDTNPQLYEVVATKCHPEIAERLRKLSHKLGMKRYGILQMAIDCIVRYMDDRHNLSAEMEQVMLMFDHLVGWADQTNFADPMVDLKPAEATYFCTTPHKHGCRAVHVSKPIMGQPQEDVNVQRILERTVCLLLPEQYQRLRRLAVDHQCSSILELINKLIDQHSKDSDVAEFRRQFEDANRSDYGRPIEYGRKTRSTHHRDIDGRSAANLFGNE